jgi:hypothetical protein
VSCRGKTPIFVYLAWRLWKSALRLLVSGNITSRRDVRRQRVPVFEKYRLPSTGSRRGHALGEQSLKNADFSVFRVAVMAKCFEACG